MIQLEDKKVLVIGLGSSGQAAARLCAARGARVTALDEMDTPSLRSAARELEKTGAIVKLATAALPATTFDIGILSPGVPSSSPLVRRAKELRIPLISELELGFQQSLCLSVAISGTNGKTTTTELVELILTSARRRTVAAGNIGLPLCSVVDRTKELDFLTLEVSSFQLEATQYFRPAVAVLLNITPDHLDRYASFEEYARTKARLFENQQVFDWAIVQSEALAQLRALGISIHSKLITISANDRNADIYLDRGLLLSRLPDWTGLLLNMHECQLRGPHNAENLMAALAVGRVLRVPLEEMVAAVKAYRPAAHRCERVAEIRGVEYVNDSKATNVDAVAKALLTVGGAAAAPIVWLIAGGKDKGFEFHDIGPLLAQRVKGAFLIGETREKIRAAWSLFTPCTLVETLPEAVMKAFACASPGDVVLLSPACSSFDMFQSYQDRGEVFRRTVLDLAAQSAGGTASMVATSIPSPAQPPSSDLPRPNSRGEGVERLLTNPLKINP